jgi:hypothetical protein
MDPRDLKKRRIRWPFVLPAVMTVFLCWQAKATETVVFSEGFESSNGSFSHTGSFDTWLWGTPSPNSPYGPRAAHSGTKCWGTMIHDTVPANSNAYLISPKISLPALGANQVMRVRFFGWIAIDYMFDKGAFEVSPDGVNWENKAELFCTMQGGWNDYNFDISDFAGDSIYLRFRLSTDANDYFNPLPFNMAGLFVDDIAITVNDAPAIRKILTFKGNEDQDSYASCPWVCTPGKKGAFEQDNDVYSTARGSGREYTDYYKLGGSLSQNKDNDYVFKLKEIDQEESFTDLFHLMVVEHSSSFDVACDDSGHVFTYQRNQTDAPSTAVDKDGNSVIEPIKSADQIGFKAYNGDYLDLGFSSMGNPTHAIFLLRAQGFMTDSTAGKPTGVKTPAVVPSGATVKSGAEIQPKIEVQTQNSNGNWVTRHVFYPRWKPAFCGYFPYSKKVRLISTSCMTGKYHLVDWVGLYTKSQKSFTMTELSPKSAIRSDGTDLAAHLSAVDGKYAHMAPSEEMVLTFHDSVTGTGNKRDFIVKSRGYYNPMGTYFFYTWNGTNWAQRDAWTIPVSGDQTRQFDLSLWLPDPDGKNRVRIWQDYLEYTAGIDYVGLQSNGIGLIMDSAVDLRDNGSIVNLVNDSDNIHFTWDGEDDAWPIRDRWVQLSWTDNFVNTPPSTNPVFVTNTNSPAPVINWTYHDIDGNPQTQYEVEVWSGPLGAGAILWDPAAGTGAASSVTYAGAPLATGRQYYARVKAFDSLSWGTWSEAAFILSATNNPPAAEAGRDTTVIATPSCVTSVVLDGSGSSDVDGDTLSFLWTGPFGNAVGAKPGVWLLPGSNLIRLIVSDGKGGSASDSVTITVRDTVKPIPDSASLPMLSGQCIVAITDPPTATDNCAGQIVGTTDSLTFTRPGSHIVVWRYDDGNGNTVTQLQTVVVSDVTAPVPDSATLPTLSGNCLVTVTKYPTAMDDCSGPITGTTADPLAYNQKGAYTITWTYRDSSGNSSMQTQQVAVTDNQPPAPDVAQLPTLQGDCRVSISSRPTATDDCKGTIVGTTADPLYYGNKGTYTVHWAYDDGNGNTAAQTQTVIVVDNTAPVPNVSPLPTINGTISGGRCYTVRTYPSATDYCKGRIVGTTSPAPTFCYKGDYIITWTYDDGNGNVTTQNQAVSIR